MNWRLQSRVCFHLPQLVLSPLRVGDGLVAVPFRLRVKDAHVLQLLTKRRHGFVTLPLLSIGALRALIPVETLMGQLGLKIADRRLGLPQESFVVLPRLDLLPESRLRGIKLICATAAFIMVPMNDRDRNLAVAGEPTRRATSRHRRLR
jgi:hypothetical protein